MIMKKLPIRLENAITKLYTAFHNNTLDAWDSCGCAVGNILNNQSFWQDTRRACRLGEIALNVSLYEEEVLLIESISGYSHQEILNVEKIFMINATGGYAENTFSQTKETQFKGLCAVVEYLCELDNIPNVMDYTKLFETENDKPKYQLS